jgi:hypothetical protein
VESNAFDRHPTEYLDDDGLRALQKLLMRNPTAGLPVPETGGVRKLRFADARRGKGKRRGLRVVYCWRLEDLPAQERGRRTMR